MPVRTAEVIKNILEASQAKKINSDKNSFDVLSNLSFLQRDLQLEFGISRSSIDWRDNPDAMNALGSIYENWVKKEKILYTNLWSELAKLTANAGAAYKLNKFN